MFVSSIIILILINTLYLFMLPSFFRLNRAQNVNIKMNLRFHFQFNLDNDLTGVSPFHCYHPKRNLPKAEILCMENMSIFIQ